MPTIWENVASEKTRKIWSLNNPCRCNLLKKLLKVMRLLLSKLEKLQGLRINNQVRTKINRSSKSKTSSSRVREIKARAKSNCRRKRKNIRRL